MNKADFEKDMQDYLHNQAKKVKQTDEWWDGVVLNAIKEEPRPQKKVNLFRKKLFLIPVAVILALVITGGTVYGYSSVVKRFIDVLVPSAVDEEAGQAINLAQEYDLTQTIDGITAKLEYAYADMNKVVVGVSVEGEKYYTVSLFTSDGQEIDKGPIGLGNGGDWAWTFNTPSIQGTQSSLNLRMEISVSDDMEPFVFDFEVPYYDGKVVDVGQTVEALGVTIELESLFISPSETQAVFYISPQTDERGSYAAPAPVYIQLPDGSVVHASLDIGNNNTGEPATECFYGDFTAQYGEWIITVDTLVYCPPLTSDAPLQTFAAEEFVYLSGPWVFTVQVE